MHETYYIVLRSDEVSAIARSAKANMEFHVITPGQRANSFGLELQRPMSRLNNLRAEWPKALDHRFITELPLQLVLLRLFQYAKPTSTMALFVFLF